MDKIHKDIDSIISAAFTKISAIYQHNCEVSLRNNTFEICEDSRLVFPCYRNGKTRVSEQELRFAFVEAFNEYCSNPQNTANYYYSIETPTRDLYNGFAVGTPKAYSNENNDDPKSYRSANFDLVIYNEYGKRICLIEFKAHNGDKAQFVKDFTKLTNKQEGDREVLKFFLLLLEDYNSATIQAVRERIKTKGDTIVRCYSVNGKELTKQIDV